MRFIDIVTLVKDIHKNFDFDCKKLSKIKVISSDVELNSVCKSVKEYFRKNKKEIEIKVYFTQPSDSETNGFYTRYEKNDKTIIDIDINNNLNTCWQRFVSTKELAHPLIDKNPKSYTKDISSLVKTLLINPPNIQIDNDIPSEYLAFFFAIEILIPYCWNDMIITTNFTSFQIADIVKVPEKIIDLIKQDWYQNLRKRSFQ